MFSFCNTIIYLIKYLTVIDIARAHSNIPIETYSEKLYTQIVKKKKNQKFIPLGSNFFNTTDHYDPISFALF